MRWSRNVGVDWLLQVGVKQWAGVGGTDACNLHVTSGLSFYMSINGVEQVIYDVLYTGASMVCMAPEAAAYSVCLEHNANEIAIYYSMARAGTRTLNSTITSDDDYPRRMELSNCSLLVSIAVLHCRGQH